MARKLRKSSGRKVWSTLLSARDWLSYLYIALAALVLIYLPYQVYQLYRRSQIQATVIESIASGDPDIRQILGLLAKDPTADWVPDKIVEKAEPTKSEYSSFEMLTRSRFIDLRRWRGWEALPERRGNAFVRERLTIKLLETSKLGGRRITLRYPIRSSDLQIRIPDSTVPVKIWHVSSPVDYHGEPRNLYEVELDVSLVPILEPVSVELEFLVPFPVVNGRIEFETYAKTDLAAIWILFPPDRPYRHYSLVHYPANRSSPPEIMQARFTIDHPWGSLIGWSVINPESNVIYECRWTSD
jgi:hypothetical protein